MLWDCRVWAFVIVSPLRLIASPRCSMGKGPLACSKAFFVWRVVVVVAVC